MIYSIKTCCKNEHAACNTFYNMVCSQNLVVNTSLAELGALKEKIGDEIFLGRNKFEKKVIYSFKEFAN